MQISVTTILTLFLFYCFDSWKQRNLQEQDEEIETVIRKLIISNFGGCEILGYTSICHDESYDCDGDFILTSLVGVNAGKLYRHYGKVKIKGRRLNFLFCSLCKFDSGQLAFETVQPFVKAGELKIFISTPHSFQKIGQLFAFLDTFLTINLRKCVQFKGEKALLERMVC